MPRAFWAALLAAALSGPAAAARRKDTLIYSRFDVDPGEWRYFEFPAKSPDARLEVKFEVLGAREVPAVRVAVLKQDDFDRFRERQPYTNFRATPYERQGTLRASLAETGDYVVVVDNRQARRRARVDLEVTLTSGPDPETLPVAYASPRTRMAVVAASVAGFLLIVFVAGRALWRATRRPPDPPPVRWA